ncbi:hypothetical protein [Planktosalinus lacus]|uniref:hypothetical protein n=1 Tax=Planktosalinus lacus TaxID=1526573 RepID=UPI001E429969|nr:hypothetical protein [Planktosalinus lacus]
MEKKSKKRRDPSASVPLFKNPVLEKLTQTHIAAPLCIFTFIVGVLFYYGIVEKGFELPFMIFLFVLGFLVFTLVEYLMHRYLYHIEPTTERSKKMTYTMHGIHHDYPKDKNVSQCHRFSASSYQLCSS